MQGRVNVLKFIFFVKNPNLHLETEVRDVCPWARRSSFFKAISLSPPHKVYKLTSWKADTPEIICPMR